MLRRSQPWVALLGLVTCLTSLVIPFYGPLTAAYWPIWLAGLQAMIAAGILVAGMSDQDTSLVLERELFSEIEETGVVSFIRVVGNNPVDFGMMIVAGGLCPILALLGPSMIPFPLGWSWCLLHMVRRAATRKLPS